VFHKLVYIIKNPLEYKPSRVVIMPYLHEKRVYLNRIKQNTEYFYTSINQELLVEKSDPGEGRPNSGVER